MSGPMTVRRRHGFTMIELLIVVIVGLLVLGSVYRVLISQSKEYENHRETIDVEETLRGAAALLTSELQVASASRGDLYAIGPDSISLRSFQTSGAICGQVVNVNRYAVWQPSGSFTAGANDSALAYKLSASTWNITKVNQVWTNPGAPLTTCTGWSGGLIPPVVVELTGDTTGLATGSVIRSFRKTTYRLFTQNGRWWLGRRLAAAVCCEVVTGPLRQPSDSGLVFHYYDATGAAITAPTTAVARVDIILRAESFKNVRSGSSTVATKKDSVTVKAFLRN